MRSIRKNRFGGTGSKTKPLWTRTDRNNGRWAGTTTWKTGCGLSLSPDVSQPGSFHRSAKVKPFRSSLWKMPAPSDMLVLIQWHGRTMGVLLSRLAGVNVDQSTAEAIGNWHYWVAQGYCF